MPYRNVWLTLASVAAGTTCLFGCASKQPPAAVTSAPETQSAQVYTPPVTTTNTNPANPTTGPGQTSGMGNSGMNEPRTGSGSMNQGPGSMGQSSNTPSMGNTPDQPSPSPSPAPSAITLTDEQITAITTAGSQAEIDQAKLAATHSKNPKVKAFADHMVKDHTQAMKDTSQLTQRLRLTPADNPMSQKLMTDSQQLMDSLRTKHGADFDKEYMGAQVKEHRELLDTLDNKLIPNAKTPEVKNELTQLRGKVEGHLREAEDIQRSL